VQGFSQISIAEMTMEVMNKKETEELALRRLTRNATGDRQFQLFPDRTVEKPFGWVLFYVVRNNKSADSSISTEKLRVIIINKHSGQVIGNSTQQPVDTIIKLYQDMLAESKEIAEDWCLTFSLGRKKKSRLKKLEEKAIAAGFYEILEELRGKGARRRKR
jgi:hypothetical protein